jgi:hypothetical protein
MGAMLAPGLHLGGVGVNMSQVVSVCPSSVPGDLHTLAATLSMWGNNKKLKGKIQEGKPEGQ